MVTHTREQQHDEMAHTVDDIKNLAKEKLEAERSLRERDGEMAALRQGSKCLHGARLARSRFRCVPEGVGWSCEPS